MKKTNLKRIKKMNFMRTRSSAKDYAQNMMNMVAKVQTQSVRKLNQVNFQENVGIVEKRAIRHMDVQS